MRTSTLALFLGFVPVVACVGQQPRSASVLNLYVAPAGNDRNPGTDAKPFATLAAAQAAVRAAKGHGASGTQVVVWVHGGLYLLDKPFTLTKEDSGEPGSPVIYRAVSGETPRIFGGSRFDAKSLVPAAGSAAQSALDPRAAGHVLRAPVGAAAARLARYPGRFRGNGGLFNLLFDGRKMPLSRWPKDAYTTMSSVLESGITPRAGGTFVYRPEAQEHAERWAEEARKGNLWLTGFWRVPFQVDSVRVARVDTKQHTITLAAPVPGGIGSKYVETINGTRHGNGKEQYYAFNLAAEIGRAGEWSYDFGAETLFFWPPAGGDLSRHEVLVASLAKAVVLMEGASDVRLENLTIEGGLDEGVTIVNGKRNVVAGCTLRNIGGGGIDVEGGGDNVVRSNDLMHLGSYGIRLVAGDRKMLTPGHNVADNNHIFAIGEQERITEGIYLGGVGNRATHNLIHDAPYNGITYSGNDELMAYNEIHHVGLDAGDMGIFYTNGDWAAQGNRIEFNFAHDSPNANGSYLDDGSSGRTTVSNIFSKLASGIFLGGGHNNLIAGNLIIDCGTGIHIDNRGVARHYDSSAHHLTNTLKTIDANSPPWSVRYPDFLSGILDDPMEPTGNILHHNAIVRAAKPYEVIKPAVVDAVLNPVIAADAGLTVERSLQQGSAVLKQVPEIGVIKLQEIGLKVDQYRVRLPSEDETGRFVDRRKMQRFDSNQDVKASDQTGALKAK